MDHSPGLGVLKNEKTLLKKFFDILGKQKINKKTKEVSKEDKKRDEADKS